MKAVSNCDCFAASLVTGSGLCRAHWKLTQLLACLHNDPLQGEPLEEPWKNMLLGEFESVNRVLATTLIG